MSCLFCNHGGGEHRYIATTSLAYARWDNFPAMPGHAEVVPWRHVESWFDLSFDELWQIHELTRVVRSVVMASHGTEEFTIGVNEGHLAGRSIHHLHLHLIPRYPGDVTDPRGGLRAIFGPQALPPLGGWPSLARSGVVQLAEHRALDVKTGDRDLSPELHLPS